MPAAAVPVAPGRFSITTGWPRSSEYSGATRHATTSMPPTGGKPTTMRTGLAGYSCAGASDGSARAKARRKTRGLAIKSSRIMSDPKPSYNPRPSRPKLKLPAGACDTHFHVFGPKKKFAFAADAAYTPADAPKETLFDLHRFLRIERGVVVQSAAHGLDNSASSDLVAARKDSYRGVALLPTDVKDAKLN